MLKPHLFSCKSSLKQLTSPKNTRSIIKEVPTVTNLQKWKVGCTDIAWTAFVSDATLLQIAVKTPWLLIFFEIIHTHGHFTVASCHHPVSLAQSQIKLD